MSRVSRFERNHFTKPSTYICSNCEHRTRETGEGESTTGLCVFCWTVAGYENSVSDGAMTQEEFDDWFLTYCKDNNRDENGKPLPKKAPVKKAVKTTAKKLEPGLTQKLHTVVVGQGLVQVLQLDDAGMRESFGITSVETKNKEQVTITATLGGLKELRATCETRARGARDGWDQPLWYASAAKAAMVRIDAAIAAITKGGK